MASWVIAHPPWQSLSRLRFRFDALVRPGVMTSKHFLNTPTLSADTETPMMKEIKAYPYPSVSPDSSLFEDPDDAYIHAAGSAAEYATSLPENRSQTDPCYTLHRLVAEGKYEDADRVHTELVEHGVEIRPHPVYHFIARKFLDTHDIPSQARVDAFVKWWSLVPPRSEWDCRRSVGFILTETLRKDAVPDIPLIARFALLAASKGYGIQVSVDVINTLARYAPRSFTIQFLEQFCIAVWKYETSLPAYQESPQRVAKDLIEVQFRAWYSSVVGAFAAAGEFAPAMAALRIACKRNIFVSQETYVYLLRRLELANEKEHVRALEALWEEQTHAIGLEIPTTPQAAEAMKITVPAHDDIATLVMSVKQLKGAYRSHTPVSARNLAAVLDALLSAGRSSIATRIRTLAYHSGDSAISTWALAEMIYYQRFGHKSLSAFLSVFEDHFYLVGVPSIIFDPVLVTEFRLRKPSVKGLKGDLHLLGPHPTLRRRLQPSLHHTYMLWRTVAHGVRRPATLVRLYRSFIEQVVASRRIYPSAVLLPPLLTPKRGSPRPAPTPPEANSHGMRPIPPHSSYDVRFFNIFIAMFGRFQFWPYLTRTIIDLHRLGFQRDHYTQNAFMQQLRFPKDMKSAHRLLSYWEDRVDRACKELEDAHWQDESAEPSMEPIVDKPDPKVIKGRTLTFFYLASIRRLTLDGRVDDAREVVARFLKAVPETSTVDSVAHDGSSLYENPELDDVQLGAAPLDRQESRMR
ncbi:hypothetical protein K466DRAFT_644678 [Polyporus arcularius HHB13444]|uniref:Uncharacterized protein n=1 Tax=Polyporus arcularius HHB13444 TaxID=1314778 RepID=A0A5C3PNT7_9APHY|nr:hypothetical protein K466DRAFT_644678 [Polyporus arcularius HHB13444]